MVTGSCGREREIHRFLSSGRRNKELIHIIERVNGAEVFDGISGYSVNGSVHGLIHEEIIDN